MLSFHREFLDREMKIIGLCGNEDWQVTVPHAIFKTLTFPDQNSSPPRLGPRPRTFFMSMSIKFIFLNYTKYVRHKHNTLIITKLGKMVNFRILDIVKKVSNVK